MNNSHFNQSEQKMLPIIITCSFRKLDGKPEVLTQNSARQLAKSLISLTCSNPTAANFHFFTSYVFVKIISPMIKGHASAKKNMEIRSKDNCKIQIHSCIPFISRINKHLNLNH